MKPIYKPILFSAPMVLAIMDGKKTQTRRIVCDHNLNFSIQERLTLGRFDEIAQITNGELKPKYKIGDILWVRETWSFGSLENRIKTPFIYKVDGERAYKIGDTTFRTKWKPSIFMPKEAARYFLEVTNVRAERLQDIPYEDAIAEGIKEITNWHNEGKHNGWKDYGIVSEDSAYYSPIDSFASLWKSINGKKSWDLNPWVWVYEFKKIEKPKNWLQCLL